MAEWELKPHPVIPKGKPVVVCILDGFGENDIKDEYNAVYTGKTPTIDKLREVAGRFRTVKAHGPAVGLPTWDDMGNSEVGHNALGAGQLIEQGARLVDKALSTGSLFENAGWKYISSAFEKNTVHFIGLLSSGGVHSRQDQLEHLVRGAQKSGAKRVRVHILLDGRDVPDGSSVADTERLEKVLEEARAAGCDAQIASGGGRMYITMDRYEADWGMVERGWKAHVLGEADHKFSNPVEAIKALREIRPNDQYLPSFVITDAEGKPIGTIEDDDAVALFNFRADRVVEISKAFEYPDFKSFDRVRFPKTKFVGLMQYDGDLKLPSNFLIPPPDITKTSGEWLVKNGIRTFACSETQKFGHVTFFWNGNRSGYFDAKLETYVEITSDVIPFDQKPDMKAREITAASLEALRSGKYDMHRVNYANPDMVGHTGIIPATIQAVETCDAQVAQVIAEVERLGGIWLVTSDHGNADDMVQREKKTNKPVMLDGKMQMLTSHTLAPVPVFIGGPGLPDTVKFRTDMPDAGLANVTATCLNLLGFEAPSIMVPSLLEC